MSQGEAIVYLELTKGPSTHLGLSRTTGISRTRVYRIADKLEKQGMIARRSDDRGKFLVALQPVFLEEKIKNHLTETQLQAMAFEKAKASLPLLVASQKNDFTVFTYAGVDGMKQMQWHELKTRGELLAIGVLYFDELVDSRRWAEKFRTRVAEAGYRTRELVCRQSDKVDMNFTDNQDFLKNYSYRKLASNLLPVGAPMVIYNDTVAIYQVDHQRKFGTEIVHAGFANTMRAIFEHYWELANKPNAGS